MGYSKNAAFLFGVAQPLFDITRNRFGPVDEIEYERNLAATHSQLNKSAFESAFTEGKNCLWSRNWIWFQRL
jgi:hypothetical protein